MESKTFRSVHICIQLHEKGSIIFQTLHFQNPWFTWSTCLVVSNYFQFVTILSLENYNNIFVGCDSSSRNVNAHQSVITYWLMIKGDRASWDVESSGTCNRYVLWYKPLYVSSLWASGGPADGNKSSVEPSTRSDVIPHLPSWKGGWLKVQRELYNKDRVGFNLYSTIG